MVGKPLLLSLSFCSIKFQDSSIPSCWIQKAFPFKLPVHTGWGWEVEDEGGG